MNYRMAQELKPPLKVFLDIDEAGPFKVGICGALYYQVNDTMAGSGDADYVCCPCKDCNHNNYIAPSMVPAHILKWGIAQPLFIGSSSSDGDSYSGDEERLHLDEGRIQPEEEQRNFDGDSNSDDEEKTQLDEGRIQFEKTEISLDDGDLNDDKGPLDEGVVGESEIPKPLYDGSIQTTFSATLSILDLQVQHGWTDASVSDLLTVLKSELLPKGNTMPSSLYHAKNQLKNHGLDYESIHACENDCILFRGMYENDVTCPKCDSHRYKPKKLPKKVPVKVLRYFPIIPRLLSLFKTPSLASLISKSAEFRSVDGKVRYPGDTMSSRRADELLHEGGSDSRHIKFGLTVDGVNPFKKLSSKWTFFPLMLAIYNFPPDLITTESYLWLLMLIPGRKQITNINIYKEPFVEEMQRLWVGIPAYDITRDVNERDFTLRAMLVHCLHDFIGYGFSAGCVVQGYHACPLCGPNLDSRYSKSLGTNFYTGNRRFLPLLHPLRSADGSTEIRGAPEKTTVQQWLQWATESEDWIEIERLKHKYPSGERKGKKKSKKFRVQISSGEYSAAKVDVTKRGPAKKHGIKQKSILFKLPYWPSIKTRHLIDVMHTEKNIAEMILSFISGKRDTDGVREDMKEIGVRRNLWIHPDVNDGERSSASYVLDDVEWKTFCQTICAMEFPSNYTTSFQPIFGEGLKDFSGIKSHSYHVLLQDVIPIAIRGMLGKGPRSSVILMGRLFKKICSPVFDPFEMNTFLEETAAIICLFERHFPPAACTIMLHLVYHVVEQIEDCGVVYTRWMYPFESAFKVLKKMVRNLAKPEASIAECYLLREAVAQASDLNMEQDTLVSKRFAASSKEKYNEGTKLLGAAKKCTLSPLQLHQAQSYVINNAPCMTPWRNFYGTVSTLDSFEEWFLSILNEFLRSGEEIITKDILDMITDDILSIACLTEHSNEYHSHKSLQCNGTKFNVESKDMALETSNSNISAEFEDQNGKRTYYGTIQDILVLSCVTFTTILVECKWFESDIMQPEPSVVVDDDGFTLVNTKKILKMTEIESQPFVNPEIMKPVLFSPDPKRKGWSVVLELRTKISASRLKDYSEDNAVHLQVPRDLL